MKQIEKKKLRYIRDKKNIIIPAIVGFVLTFLAVFQITNPYFYHFKIFKIGFYSLSIFIPAMIQQILGFGFKIAISDPVFYLICFIYHFCVAYVINLIYQKSRNKRKKIWLIIGIILYVAICTFILW